MPDSIGTRTKDNISQLRQEQGSDTRTRNQDVGMSKRAAVALTFATATAKITAANGTFSAFAKGDPIEVQGVASNNGFFNVTEIDAANGAYLVVDPPPKDEGPIAGVVRTA